MLEVVDTTGVTKGTYALKRLKNTESPERRERFVREVAALNKLTHQNILHVLDYDLEVDKPYYVSEFCERGSLDRVGAERFKGNIHETTEVLLPIADALAAAHKAGVIHRDLKPSNILIRRDGTPVLGDFGICHIEAEERVTLSDDHVGSVNFIAPEAESGMSYTLGEPTDRTDVYSLGKVLFWMLSGGQVFARENHRMRSLVVGLHDQRFEHIHDLLDRMVVQHSAHRLTSARLREEFEMARSLIEGNYSPLKPSLGIRCRFCGLGQYEKYAEVDAQNNPRPTGNFFGLGLEANRSGADIRVLRCSHCGHIEIFQFRAIKDREWWNK